MLRCILGIMLLLAGAATTAYGVMVELQVRSDVGTGLRRWLAQRFYASQIDAWRSLSDQAVILGPALIILAYLLIRGWGGCRCRAADSDPAG